MPMFKHDVKQSLPLVARFLDHYTSNLQGCFLW